MMKSKFVLFIIIALVAGMTLAGPAVRSLRTVVAKQRGTQSPVMDPLTGGPTLPPTTTPPTTKPPTTTSPPTTQPPTTQPPTQPPDTDGDGISDDAELIADTDPTNKNSALRILGLVNDINGLRVDWQGGSAVTQFLERSYDLSTNPVVWTPVFTNLPPTPISTNILDADNTNGQAYYRLRVVR